MDAALRTSAERQLERKRYAAALAERHSTVSLRTGEDPERPQRETATPSPATGPAIAPLYCRQVAGETASWAAPKSANFSCRPPNWRHYHSSIELVPPFGLRPPTSVGRRSCEGDAMFLDRRISLSERNNDFAVSGAPAIRNRHHCDPVRGGSNSASKSASPPDYKCKVYTWQKWPWKGDRATSGYRCADCSEPAVLTLRADRLLAIVRLSATPDIVAP
jgi:hypothetical protein